jgi:hypothetical protein
MNIHTSITSLLRLALLGTLAAATPAFAADIASIAQADQANFASPGHDHVAPARLVQTVKDNTKQFFNPGDAEGAGYKAMFGCVSGPQEGAMGVHYVNGTLAGDGELDATKPEALIYEFSKGRARLVGVEYIVDAVAWFQHHKDPPMLEGQAFQFNGAPNRYNLAAFFELHVWAWRDNPNGAFVDWNTRVSCEGQ